jgi:hypothetical protein
VQEKQFKLRFFFECMHKKARTSVAMVHETGLVDAEMEPGSLSRACATVCVTSGELNWNTWIRFVAEAFLGKLSRGASSTFVNFAKSSQRYPR